MRCPCRARFRKTECIFMELRNQHAPGGGWSDLSRRKTNGSQSTGAAYPLAVLGDYSLYRGWIISLQWSAPNRLSHRFSQSPGISSGKLASSEDSHGSRQARSADYGDSFTKLHFPRIPRKLAPITMGQDALRGFSRRYYFIIRVRERASPSLKSLILFNLRNNTMIRRRAIRSFIRRDREFFVEFPKLRQTCSHELLLFDITAVSAGFQLNGLLAKRG